MVAVVCLDGEDAQVPDRDLGLGDIEGKLGDSNVKYLESAEKASK